MKKLAGALVSGHCDSVQKQGEALVMTHDFTRGIAVIRVLMAVIRVLMERLSSQLARLIEIVSKVSSCGCVRYWQQRRGVGVWEVMSRLTEAFYSKSLAATLCHTRPPRPRKQGDTLAAKLGTEPLL